MTARPHTPETLADLWHVSAETIRQLCHQGRLRHFRVGRMFRISTAAVEEFEACQNTESEGSMGASSSPGMITASDGVIVLTHSRPRGPRQRP